MTYHNTARKLLFSVLASFALLSAVLPLTASAACQGGTQGGQGGPNGGLVDLYNCSDNGITTAGIQVGNKQDVVALIAKVIDWALYLSGAIAVVFVIIGGYRYLTAGGNEETATKARKAVVNALIGLVIIILAYVIVNVVANFITS